MGQQTLTSTAPAVFAALYELIQGAVVPLMAEAFQFALAEHEPDSYVLVEAIKNHNFEWESIGTFSQKEHYDVAGVATVFSGSATPDDPTVQTDVLNATYDLFNNAVMLPVMSNRLMPLLGADPRVYQMLPGWARYAGNPGSYGGSQGGWSGVIEWSFHFDAYITPTAP